MQLSFYVKNITQTRLVSLRGGMRKLCGEIGEIGSWRDENDVANEKTIDHSRFDAVPDFTGALRVVIFEFSSAAPQGSPLAH